VYRHKARVLATYSPLYLDFVILLFQLALLLCLDHCSAYRLGLFDLGVNAGCDGINNSIALLLKVPV
jgi:hypothetical protein